MGPCLEGERAERSSTVSQEGRTNDWELDGTKGSNYVEEGIGPVERPAELTRDQVDKHAQAEGISKTSECVVYDKRTRSC